MNQLLKASIVQVLTKVGYRKGKRGTMNRMLLIVVCLALTVAAIEARAVMAVTLDFEDLASDTVLTGAGYAGLTWEWGNNGYEGNQGYWMVPVSLDSYPYSGEKNAINAWGCTLIGIAFPVNVNVLGAYFAAQGDEDSWTDAVRVHGYRNASEVAVTGWFTDIDTQPDWLQMNLNNVDRIVIESVPVIEGGGWYGMDDLTFELVPEPTTLTVFALTGLALFMRYRRRRNS